MQATIRLSAHVLAVDPDQLPAQLAGRTIGRCEPELARLHAAARAWPHAAWLCPIWPTLAQPGEALRQTLTGHDGEVEAVAVSADGRTAVSGGEDGTVRVWDLAGTAAPRVLTGHDGDVEAVAVSADGRTAVSGGDDGTVRVWDLAGTAAPRVLTGHDGSVAAVAVSADGRTAVSGGDDGTVRVWDLAGTAAPRVLTGHDGPVVAVAVSADGRTAVSGGGDGTVRVWDLAGTAAPRVLTGHDGPVQRGGGQRGRADRGQRRRRRRHGAGVGPGRDRRAAGAHRPRRPGAARWRSARTGGPRSAAATTARCGCGTWPGPPRRGCSPATPALGERRWRSARTGGPRSAAASTARCGCGTWPGPPRRGCSPATTARCTGWRSARTGGPRSAAASDGTVRVWDLAGTAAPRVLTGHDGPVSAVAVSADGRTAVSGGQDGTVRVWDLAGTAAPRVLTGHDGWVNGVAVSADGRTAVSGGQRRHGAGVGPGRDRRAAGAHRPRRPGGRRWRSARTGGPRSAAAAATARCGCGTWPGPPRRGCSPATTARSARWRSARTGGPRSAAAATGTVRVWDLAGTAAPRVLTGHAGEVWAVAVSADGRTAVSGGDDRHGAGVGPGRRPGAGPLDSRRQMYWPSPSIPPSPLPVTRPGRCTRSS